MTTYKEEYNKIMSVYKKNMASYEDMISSPRYDQISCTMPFEFLNAIHLCEKLSLFEKLEKKPKMYFSNIDEALVFYRNLISFNQKTETLLEDASYITTVGTLANTINELAINSPYLGKTFCIRPNNELISLAEKCLSEIPRYPEMLTKAFKWNFIESAILSFNKEALKTMVDYNIIKAKDLDHINLTETMNDYQEKIHFLCTLLNHEHPILASYTLKLKAVTFSNEDGSSRQEYLSLLKQYAKAHPEETIKLTAESYIYTPEIGEPEPAIRILWDDKILGNIGKDVVKEIQEVFDKPQYTVLLKEITGGDKGISYGCNIDFNVVAPGCIPTKDYSILEE